MTMKICKTTLARSELEGKEKGKKIYFSWLSAFTGVSVYYKSQELRIQNRNKITELLFTILDFVVSVTQSASLEMLNGKFKKKLRILN